MAQAARKVTAKDANEKLAHRRLTALELAERPAHSSFTLCTQPLVRMGGLWRRAL